MSTRGGLTGLLVEASGVQVAGNSVANGQAAVIGRVSIDAGSLSQTGHASMVGGLEVGSANQNDAPGGFEIHGGVRVTGDTRAAGQAVVHTDGALVLSGSADVHDGATVTGGIVSSGDQTSPGLRVQSGGINVAFGGLDSRGLLVSSGGLNAGGGVAITAAGLTLSGGLNVAGTGVLIGDGVQVADGGLAVNSGQSSLVASLQGSASVDVTPGQAWDGVFVPGGSYTGVIECGRVQITIDGVDGSGDTFSWAMCERPCSSSVFECFTRATNVIIVADQPTALADGLTLSFSAATGHEMGATYAFDFSLTNAMRLSNAGGSATAVITQDGAVQVSFSLFRFMFCSHGFWCGFSLPSGRGCGVWKCGTGSIWQLVMLLLRRAQFM